MCIAIPPKYPVDSVIGFLKGKSAIAMARLCGVEDQVLEDRQEALQDFISREEQLTALVLLEEVRRRVLYKTSPMASRSPFL
jgi:hypothetical protein